MEYIYDILLNYNKEFYEFYEWKNKDNIINVRKIPCFKVSEDVYIKLKYNIVVLGEKFVEMIKGKTSYYTSNRGNNNLCIFTSKKDAFGAMIDNKGRIIQRSSLLLEESEEIIEEFADKKITDINIIRNQNSKCTKVGRLERERKQEIKQNINNDKLGIEKLKYIFYDYFEEEENNDKIIKQKILKELNKPWNKKLNNMYNTIKLISKIKN